MFTIVMTRAAPRSIPVVSESTRVPPVESMLIGVCDVPVTMWYAARIDCQTAIAYSPTVISRRAWRGVNSVIAAARPA